MLLRLSLCVGDKPWARALQPTAHPLLNILPKKHLCVTKQPKRGREPKCAPASYLCGRWETTTASPLSRAKAAPPAPGPRSSTGTQAPHQLPRNSACLLWSQGSDLFPLVSVLPPTLWGGGVDPSSNTGAAQEPGLFTCASQSPLIPPSPV